MYVTTQRTVEDIVLSEMRPTQRDRFFMTPLTGDHLQIDS